MSIPGMSVYKVMDGVSIDPGSTTSAAAVNVSRGQTFSIYWTNTGETPTVDFTYYEAADINDRFVDPIGSGSITTAAGAYGLCSFAPPTAKYISILALNNNTDTGSVAVVTAKLMFSEN